MKLRFSLISGLILALATLGFTEDPVARLMAALEKFRNDYPQEKVYLHLDKPYYSVGDTIWFSAYVVDAENNLPTAKSGILYADLVNEQGAIWKGLRLPLVQGRGAGDFVLTDSLKEGYYRVRSYTNWMRNFGEEFFFDRTIYIGDALTSQVLTSTQFTFSKVGTREAVQARIAYTDFEGKPLVGKEVTYTVDLDSRNVAKGNGVTDAAGVLTVSFVNAQPFNLKQGAIGTRLKMTDKEFVSKSIPVKSTAQNSDIQFFPEGGRLIDSVPARVAVKVVGEDGLGIDAAGYVTDAQNNRVAEFKTLHRGMGVFRLNALGGTYTAHVQLPDGSEKTINLPASVRSGAALSITPSGQDSLRIMVNVSRDLIGSGELSVLAQSGSRVVYAAKSPLSTKRFLAKVARSRFPAGVIQFTLMDQQGRPIAERIAFNRVDQAGLTVTTAATYKPREKVKMDLKLNDPSGKPVAGNFSASVINFTRIPSDEADETSIFSELLLGSDLKGYIEKPNYYFTDPNEEKDGKLDVLLLTQGWRRFSWQELGSGIYPPLVFQPETSITISGRVRTTNDKPVVNGKVVLLATAGNTLILDTVTNADGVFRFDGLVFPEETKFVVQARTDKGKKNVNIELDQPPSPFKGKNKNFPDVRVSTTADQLTYLRARKDELDDMKANGMLKRSIVLNEVKLATTKVNLAKNSRNLNGAGNADAVIGQDQLRYGYALSQVLQGRVAGLIVRGGVPYLTRAMNSSLRGPVPMALYLDGMQVDIGMLDAININDVESIEVLKSASYTAMYGINGSGGVLLVTTKRGERNMDYANYSSGIATVAPKGYHPFRQFYSPNYDVKAAPVKFDYRSTVYWNPYFNFSREGAANLEFFTSDTPGRYRATVEGITAEGHLGRKVVYFTVAK